MGNISELSLHPLLESLPLSSPTHTSSINVLPDEVLCAVVQYLSVSSLRHVSLVSRRWQRLARPEFFRSLNLARRTATELAELHDELVYKDDGSEGPLVDARLSSLFYAFAEGEADQQEFVDRHSVGFEILEAIKGSSTLYLDFSLNIDTTHTFRSTFVPAIEAFFHVMRSLIVKELRLRLDVFALSGLIDDEADHGDDPALVNKINRIIEIFSADTTTSICLSGLRVKSLPVSLGRTFAQPSVKHLSLQDCGPAFIDLGIPTLHKLDVSWGGQDVNDWGLQAALNICKNSAETLQELSLQNVMRRSKPLSRDSLCPFQLPELTHLTLADNHMGFGSLFDLVTQYVDLPKLTNLVLATEDIITAAEELAGEIPDDLPTLRNLRLIEGVPRRTTQGEISGLAFGELERKCQRRGVKLQTDLTIRPQTPGELAYEFERVKVLANTLIKISIGCQTSTLLDMLHIPSIHVPECSELLVSLASSGVIQTPSNNSPEDAKPVPKPCLKLLLDNLHAPALSKLQITLYIDDASAEGNLNDLRIAIAGKQYPCLDTVRGAFLAYAGTGSQGIQDQRYRFELLCMSRGIDYHAFKFIPR